MSLAAFRIPKPRLRVKPQRQPDAVRLFYFAQLRTYLARMHALVAKYVLPVLASVAPDHQDADPVKTAIAKATAALETEMPKSELRALARQVFQRTSGFQRDQVIRQMQDAIGVQPLLRDEGLADKAREFIDRNVELITSIPDKYFDGVREKIDEGVNAGRRAADIAKDLEDRYNVAESDALLVANTEVGKLYGELNQTRQEDLGVTQFEWVTSNDGRVRETHKEFDGQVYDWADPPYDSALGENVIPGQAPNCRCSAIPVLED